MYNFSSLTTEVELLRMQQDVIKNNNLVTNSNILIENHFKPIPLVASLQSEFTSNTGDRFVTYFLLKGDTVNGMGWGVTEDSIPKHIASFKGMPFTVTAKRFFPNSPYGELTDHPVTDDFKRLGISRPRAVNDLIQQSDFQEEFRVGNIDDVFKDADGNWQAFIKIKPQFASMQMPLLVSPGIFQLDPREPAGKITNWLGMHITGLDEAPAYGNAAVFKGSCAGTKGQCMAQLTAKLTNIVTPCQISRLGKIINQSEIELKLLELKTGVLVSTEREQTQVKPLLCKKDGKLAACIPNTKFNTGQ